MPPEVLRELLRRRPFVPFRLYLTDGSNYEVRHPEAILVGPASAWLGTMIPNHPFPALEQVTIFALLHVIRLEQGAPTGSPSNN